MESESEIESVYTDDSYPDDSYLDAFEIIKGIEEVNLKQFPKIVMKYLGPRKGKISREELIDEMKRLLHSSLDTRMSILIEFLPETMTEMGLNAETIHKVYESIDKIDDPVRMISTLTLEQKSIFPDRTLKEILKSDPEGSLKIVNTYTN